MFEKFYLREIAAVDLSKIYFQKNAKKACKPTNRDWIKLAIKLIRILLQSKSNVKYYIWGFEFVLDLLCKTGSKRQTEIP